MTTLSPGPSQVPVLPEPEMLVREHRQTGRSAPFIAGHHFTLDSSADPGRSAKRPRSRGIVEIPRRGMRS
jgi:hypothetical protein